MKLTVIVTTSIVNVRNWEINGTKPLTHTPTWSIRPPPFAITVAPNQQFSPNVTGTYTTSTRMITPPPYPWKISKEDKSDNIVPPITFVRGPAKPTCTEACGQKCEVPKFCHEPCLDCGPSKDWVDPVDINPPALPAVKASTALIMTVTRVAFLDAKAGTA